MKHFTTERRWWFWISTCLFVVAWFLPIVGGKGADEAAGWHFWSLLFAYPSHFVETVLGLGMLSLVFGIPAIALGWVAQAAIVIVRQARKRS